MQRTFGFRCRADAIDLLKGFVVGLITIKADWLTNRIADLVLQYYIVQYFKCCMRRNNQELCNKKKLFGGLR